MLEPWSSETLPTAALAALPAHRGLDLCASQVQKSLGNVVFPEPITDPQDLQKPIQKEPTHPTPETCEHVSSGTSRGPGFTCQKPQMGLLESRPRPAAQGFCQGVPHPVAPRSGELRHHGGLARCSAPLPSPSGSHCAAGSRAALSHRAAPPGTTLACALRPASRDLEGHERGPTRYTCSSGRPCVCPTVPEEDRCGERPQLTPPSWCHPHRAVPVNQLPGCRGGSPGPPAPPPSPRPIPGALRVVCGTSGLRHPRASFPGAVRECTGPLP